MTNYTLADLQAMTDDGLNALAAELRGLQYLPRSGNVFDFVWMDGDKVYAQEIAFTVNRNQSGELLQWAAERGIAAQINFGEIPFIEVTWPDAPENLHSLNGASWTEVPGNDARAETIAFCAAMLAMAGRLQ